MHAVIIRYLPTCLSADLISLLKMAIHKSTSYRHYVITVTKCIYESKQSGAAHQLVSPFALDMSHHSLLPYDCLCVSMQHIIMLSSDRAEHVQLYYWQ